MVEACEAGLRGTTPIPRRTQESRRYLLLDGARPMPAPRLDMAGPLGWWLGVVWVGVGGLVAFEEGVASEGDDDSHGWFASLVSLVVGVARVATMTALMVCMRFSAWSKAALRGDSKTSSVTSRPSMPVLV